MVGIVKWSAVHLVFLDRVEDLFPDSDVSLMKVDQVRAEVRAGHHDVLLLARVGVDQSLDGRGVHVEEPAFPESGDVLGPRVFGADGGSD